MAIIGIAMGRRLRKTEVSQSMNDDVGWQPHLTMAALLLGTGRRLGKISI